PEHRRLRGGDLRVRAGGGSVRTRDRPHAPPGGRGLRLRLPRQPVQARARPLDRHRGGVRAGARRGAADRLFGRARGAARGRHGRAHRAGRVRRGVRAAPEQAARPGADRQRRQLLQESGAAAGTGAGAGGCASGPGAVSGRGSGQPQALGRLADRRLRLEGTPRRRCGRVGPARAGAGEPRCGQRRAAACAGAADRRIGCRTFRRDARTGATDRRRTLVKSTLVRLRPRSAYGRAALLMLGSTLSFAMMVLAIRYATATVPTTEIAFFRNLFGLLALLPLILRRGAGLPRTRQVGQYLARTAIGLASMLCGFWAVGHLPLAQAISLSYATPLFVTIGAVLWLGETVRIRRWMAVAAGFVGVLVILRPGTGFTPGMMVAVMGALFAGVVAIQIKQLSRYDSPDTVVFYTYVFWVPMSLLPALLQWVWPSPTAWLWLVATGMMGTFGQLLWTRALALGEVSALQPISFVQLPVLVAFGWWLFGETIDAWTLAGAAIVLGANGYIAHRETMLLRRSATRAPLEAAKPGE